MELSYTQLNCQRHTNYKTWVRDPRNASALDRSKLGSSVHAVSGPQAVMKYQSIIIRGLSSSLLLMVYKLYSVQMLVCIYLTASRPSWPVSDHTVTRARQPAIVDLERSQCLVTPRLFYLHCLLALHHCNTPATVSCNSLSTAAAAHLQHFYTAAT